MVTVTVPTAIARRVRTQDTTIRAVRGSLKEWPLRDGPRPPGVGGSW